MSHWMLNVNFDPKLSEHHYRYYHRVISFMMASSCPNQDSFPNNTLMSKSMDSNGFRSDWKNVQGLVFRILVEAFSVHFGESCRFVLDLVKVNWYSSQKSGHWAALHRHHQQPCGTPKFRHHQVVHWSDWGPDWAISWVSCLHWNDWRWNLNIMSSKIKEKRSFLGLFEMKGERASSRRCSVT